ncbi:MAG TPA: MBL fold metallo-hydrolase [Spirochaetales bacterium]|nr:MBL fold metallo-hydrolase [Spirochaetales bacterium]HOV38441.1 MBL fold metallo-hydrolase [Spirochaetales bacterium]
MEMEKRIEEIQFPRLVKKEIPSKEFMNRIRSYPAKENTITMWALGQNGYILKTPEDVLIAIDPYLTDYCASKRTGIRTERSRILPVFIEPEDLAVDVMVITHSHCDHADPFTLERYAWKERTIFLAPWQAVQVLKEAGIPAGRIELMHPLQSWKGDGVEIIGSFAEPTSFDDLNHLGFVFRFSNGKVYYNSGDTAKTELLIHVRSFQIDWMTICINGGYHNLSHWEAAEIVSEIKPKVAVPAHFDMMPHNVQPPHMFRQSLFKLAPEVVYRELRYYTAEEF